MFPNLDLIRILRSAYFYRQGNRCGMLPRSSYCSNLQTQHPSIDAYTKSKVSRRRMFRRLRAISAMPCCSGCEHIDSNDHEALDAEPVIIEKPDDFSESLLGDPTFLPTPQRDSFLGSKSENSKPTPVPVESSLPDEASSSQCSSEDLVPAPSPDLSHSSITSIFSHANLSWGDQGFLMPSRRIVVKILEDESGGISLLYQNGRTVSISPSSLGSRAGAFLPAALGPPPTSISPAQGQGHQVVADAEFGVSFCGML